MKNTFLAFLVILSIPAAFAQAKYFTVHADRNNFDYVQCKTNHNIIFQKYGNQLESEIARLLVGIDYEESAKSPAKRIESYYRVLIELTIKKIMIEEMAEQLKAFQFDKKFVNQQGKEKSILNTDSISININQRVSKVLTQSLKKYRSQELTGHIIDSIKTKMMTNIAYTVGGHLLKSATASVVTNLSGNALKGLVLTLGSEALAGAARGSALTILAAPLMGNRGLPTKDWIKLLNKYPELVINPEWMLIAGSQDNPWSTHCMTILRETEDMEKVLDKSIQKEEDTFQLKVTRINQIKKLQPIKKEITYKPLIAIDNTYVKKPLILEDFPPFWADKK